MRLVLGCIATDLAGAFALAAVLRRSKIPVRVHVGVPTRSDEHHRTVPFEIIALTQRYTANALSEVRAAGQCLSERGARRVFLHYGMVDAQTLEPDIGAISDALIDALQDDAAASHELSTACLHCLADPTVMQTDDERACECLRTQTSRDVARITLTEWHGDQQVLNACLQSLAEHKAAHWWADAVAEEQLVSLVRASERLRMLAGSAAFASHLPALLRVRGFLSSADHATLAPVPLGGQLIIAPPELATAMTSELAGAGSMLAVISSSAADTHTTLRHHVYEGGGRHIVAIGADAGVALMRALNIDALDISHEGVPGVPWAYAKVDAASASPLSISVAVTPQRGLRAADLVRAFAQIHPVTTD